MRVLVDTNIVLDVLLNRVQHVAESLRIWTACDAGSITGFLAAHAVTTIHYLIAGKKSASETQAAMAGLLRVFSVATVDSAVIHAALKTGAPDFEDAVTSAAAFRAECQLIVTRDRSGFRTSPVPAIEPSGLLQLIAVQSDSARS